MIFICLQRYVPNDSVGDLDAPTPTRATVYLGATEATDPDTGSGSTGDVVASRYYTFAGATVATATAATGSAPAWQLLLGDIQGSVSTSMELIPNTSTVTGFEPADTSHTITRDAYLPYGGARGSEDIDTDRGWLGQYEDTHTGLTYLNARYYDPVLGRFLSPDPLLNPGDPRTLDPYRYADNNPISYTDASGLMPMCNGLSAAAAANCRNQVASGKLPNPAIPGPKVSTPFSGGSTTPSQNQGSCFIVGNCVVTPHSPFIPPPGGSPSGSSSNTTASGAGLPFGSLIAKPCIDGPLSAAQCAAAGTQGGIGSIQYWLKNGGLRSDGRWNTPAGTPDWLKTTRNLLFGSVGRKATTAASHLDFAGPVLGAIGVAASLLDSWNHLEDIGVRDKMSTTEIAYNVVGRTAVSWTFGAVFATVAVAWVSPHIVLASASCTVAAPVCAAVGVGAVTFAAGTTGDMVGTWYWDQLADDQLRKKHGAD